MRLAVRLTRGIATAVAWLLSVALAGSVGFGLGLYEAYRPPAARGIGSISVPAGPRSSDGENPDRRRTASVAEPSPAIVAPDAGPARAEAVPAPEAAAEPDPTPAPLVAAAPRRKPAPTPVPSETPVPPPAEPEAALGSAEPEPVVVAELHGPTPLERARAAERLADEDDLARAKEEAAALLGEHESYTALTAAFVADGVEAPVAQLTAVRMLQLAGEDAMSRELARELRRSYGATEEISDSIRRWGLLSPRILSATPSIDGAHLVVNGKLENPDIGRVRRLRVQVEALDAGGNLLGTVEARVRPSVLEAGKAGDFTATFKKLDPSSVLRTRASVVEWESELIGNADEPAPRATESAD